MYGFFRKRKVLHRINNDYIRSAIYRYKKLIRNNVISNRLLNFCYYIYTSNDLLVKKHKFEDVLPYIFRAILTIEAWSLEKPLIVLSKLTVKYLYYKGRQHKEWDVKYADHDRIDYIYRGVDQYIIDLIQKRSILVESLYRLLVPYGYEHKAEDFVKKVLKHGESGITEADIPDERLRKLVVTAISNLHYRLRDVFR